ncbi:EAL domain-containing protein [Nakamurella sp. YIM 132087]|uniref:EAL domain-containing protein n=1 Tax=Nakamurella alba TaxID=2665158 RepID=A0A7K1FNG4_9ACTN|nr:EAL domain-containing protein [Nakamurella alba]MTD15705.1 EAL domain-containing protein [Nakamurella alba]
MSGVTEPAQDRRLEELVDVVVRMASGDLDARMDISARRDLVDAVSTGINMLAGELRDVHAELEMRVAARTTELEAARVELERMALEDPLTGLANRVRLSERLAEACDRQDGRPPPSVLMIDVDHFKDINDTMGHAAGDAVLIEVARRLLSLVPDRATVARMGGDEFCVLVPEASRTTVHRMASEMLRALHGSFLIAGRIVSAGASIGVRDGEAGLGPAVLLRDADTALYAAKASGRGAVQVFRRDMHDAVVDRLTLGIDLAEAIAQDRLFLQFQPIVRLSDDVMVAAEALVRWQHPQRGLLSPSAFVPIAETSGLIDDLGRWVVRDAIRRLADWQRRLPLDPEFQLHVNISAVELRRSGMDRYVVDQLAAHGVPPSRLLIELSETALMTAGAGATDRLQALRDAGVGVAIDDFGTGYSSISYLRRLPIDTVKLDRSLITGLDRDPDQRGFLAAVLQLIDSVGLRSVVEGVESAGELRTLRDLGAGLAQGFHLGRPLSPTALEASWGPACRRQQVRGLHSA